MKIPRRAAKWLIWLLGLLVWIAHPFIMISFYEVTQQLGWYPPEADSIAIPIIGGFTVGLIGFPFFIILCVAATKRITGSLNLFAWDSNRKSWSIFMTLIFGLFVLSNFQSIYRSVKLLDEIKESTYIQHEFPTVVRMVLSFGWAVLWLLMRSCFVTPKSAEQGVADDR